MELPKNECMKYLLEDTVFVLPLSKYFIRKRCSFFFFEERERGGETSHCVKIKFLPNSKRMIYFIQFFIDFK